MMGRQPWISLLRLRMEIGLWRWGWASVVVALLLGLAGGAFALRSLWTQDAIDVGQRLTQLTAEIEAARQTIPAAPEATPEQIRVKALRAVVYGKDAVTPLVRDVFVRARRHGLTAREADFRLTTQGFAGLAQQQMVLPLQGNYPAFRAFVIDLLRNHPGVSVDQIQIKRAGVSQGAPEIRVRLSIWTDPDKNGAVSPDVKGNGQ